MYTLSNLREKMYIKLRNVDLSHVMRSLGPDSLYGKWANTAKSVKKLREVVQNCISCAKCL